MEYFVQVIKYSNHEVVRTLGLYPSAVIADRVEDAVNINLNDDVYYTLVKQA